ncbi:MAG: hypothetical protein QHJ73_14935, partial [Armatimonadota bacterium]|nr:hypothetical protein [Armatimonadota bacterium]
MTSYLLLGVLATGPYSGVSVDTLMDTPILERREIAALPAAEFARRARGARLEGEGEEAAAVLGEGFSLEWEVDLPAREALLQLSGSAPSLGSDSLWVALDGQRVPTPLTFSRGAFSQRTLSLEVPVAGRHVIGLSLREGPGARVRSLSLVQLSVKSPLPPMR